MIFIWPGAAISMWCGIQNTAIFIWSGGVSNAAISIRKAPSISVVYKPRDSGRRFMQAWMLKDCEGGPRVDEFLYVAIFAPAFFQEVLFASRGWRSHGA